MTHYHWVIRGSLLPTPLQGQNPDALSSSQSVPLEGSHEPVNPILNASNTAQSFPEGTDGLPAEGNPNNDGRIVAALERMTLHPGEVRRLDELISSVTADDDDDEIPPSVDTFRPFTDISTDEVDFLDKIVYGDNPSQ